MKAKWTLKLPLHRPHLSLDTALQSNNMLLELFTKKRAVATFSLCSNIKSTGLLYWQAWQRTDLGSRFTRGLVAYSSSSTQHWACLQGLMGLMPLKMRGTLRHWFCLYSQRPPFVVHTALQFWPILKRSRVDFPSTHATASCVHRNWAGPKHVSMTFQRSLLATQCVSMPSKLGQGLYKKNVRPKNIFHCI